MAWFKKQDSPQNYISWLNNLPIMYQNHPNIYIYILVYRSKMRIRIFQFHLIVHEVINEIISQLVWLESHRCHNLSYFIFFQLWRRLSNFIIQSLQIDWNIISSSNAYKRNCQEKNCKSWIETVWMASTS